MVAAITPWNFPNQINLAKLGPALAAGCTVVLKPAPQTPWTGAELGRLVATQTDIPPGVVNVLTASGATVAEALTADPRVDMISFTGSTATGRHVMAAAAPTLKKVFLELGGKSAAVVLDDYDVAAAATLTAFSVCIHAGQGCALTTRLIVPRGRYDEAVAAGVQAMRAVTVGDPADAATVCGPVISAAQRDRVESYLRSAAADGGAFACGGGRVAGRDAGYWIEPTVITGLAAAARAAREEIFGPVLVVLAHDGDDDAVALANDSPTGCPARSSAPTSRGRARWRRASGPARSASTAGSGTRRTCRSGATSSPAPAGKWAWPGSKSTWRSSRSRCPRAGASMNMDVNLADLVAAVGAALPDRCALVCDGDRLSYPELTARSNQVARHLAGAGLAPDEPVGLYLLNSAAYIEALLGCMVARTIPVNINYRYTGHELAQLLGSARLAALVVDAEHAGLAAEVAPSCPTLRHVLITGRDPAEPAPRFPGGVTVTDYAPAVAAAPASRPDNGRSGDDKLIIYTGGTTGLPKGVLWRHEDFFFAALAGGNHYGPARQSVDEIVAAAAEVPAAGYVITAPMMHGAGTYTLFSALLLGATVVLSRRFDAAAVLRQVKDERAMALQVVGDAMARPIADELAAQPGAYDLSSLFVLGSGGALLSAPVREQLHALLPNVYITDRFGASETGTDGELTRIPVTGRGWRTRETCTSSTSRCARCPRAGPGGWPSRATCRSATTATSPPPGPRSRSWTGSGTRCSATWPGSRTTARSWSSAGARRASIPAARRCFRRRSSRR